MTAKNVFNIVCHHLPCVQSRMARGQYAEYGNAARKVFLKIQKSAPALVRHLTCNRKAAPGLLLH